ncbi:MAG: metallophosphoesterase [Bacillus sp. (in: firmicutes)]
MTEKKYTSDHDQFVQDGLLNKEMDRRSFLGKTTKMAGVALGATLLGPLNALPADAASRSSIMNSNGAKPDLVFPVISDVHIYTDNDKNLNKFKTTLDQLNQVAPEQDAFAIVGDLTEYGDVPQYDKFMSAFNASKQSKTVPLMVMGNHDYWNGLSVADAQSLFLNKTGMESLYFHKVINGYHFIMLGTEDGLTEGRFSVKQINWLGEQLKLAHEDDPRIIHQEDFTSIGTSTGAYLWMDAGRIQGEVPEGADILNQALIVEVYKNKVLIKPRDIHNNDWTGEPFEISLPANKNNFKYTEKRRDKKAPTFSKDAMVSIVQDETTAVSLTLMLTQAKDDVLVHDYKIIAKRVDTGEVEKEVLAFSEYYKDPVPNPLTLTIDRLKPNTFYEFEIIALDAYGKESPNSLKVLGKTMEGKDISISLSKTHLNGVHDTVEVTVENAREPKSDWIGLYEVNEEPGGPASIWWMWTEVKNGTLTFTYDPSKNFYPTRYKEGSTYKLLYFYGSGYDVVASATFTVGKEI